MKDLIDRKTGRMKLIDAPVGVFVFRDEFVLKTEYMTNIDGVYIPDCYILSTGEKFWGGMKSKEDFKTKYNNLDVEVIDIMPSAHLESKQQATVSSDCISRQGICDWLNEMEKYGRKEDAHGYHNACAYIAQLPPTQLDRDIPKKPREETDASWGCRKIPVCPECDRHLSFVAFIESGKGEKITYCEHCGQAIDWERWIFDD